jgi:hypothetical protein
MSDNEVGYKKPPKDAQWEPGQSGNPGGLTSEQAAKRKANRDKAFAIEERMLAALEKDMTEDEARILGHIKSDVLRLIHTAIEREDGKPQQRVDNTSSDGSASQPSTVRLVVAGVFEDEKE